MADEDFKHSLLNTHNYFRSQHEGTPNVVWSDDLAHQAQDWADHLADLGKLKHATEYERRGQGENLVGCKGVPMTGEAATKKWYNEIKNFDFGQKRFHHKTGHFTQVVWKASLEIGAGVATAEDGSTFCVVRYFPAGNFKGRYDENVGSLLDVPQSHEEMDEARHFWHMKNTEQERLITDPHCQEWKDDTLKAHNDFRARHEDTPSLSWNDNLAWEAQQWANEVAAMENAVHASAEERRGLGENIACTKGKPITGVSATAHWYSEIEDFNFNNKRFDPTTGHFTQVIWKDCREVGAGMATSAGGMNFVVARYSPPGNWKNKYDDQCGDLI